MRGRRISIAGIALIITVVGSASAETWKGKELEGKWRAAAWHFGPFRMQPQLIISNAGIDSNILYSPTAPIKDFTITAWPAATLGEERV